MTGIKTERPEYHHRYPTSKNLILNNEKSTGSGLKSGNLLIGMLEGFNMDQHVTQLGDFPAKGVFELMCDVMTYFYAEVLVHFGMEIDVVLHACLADKALLGLLNPTYCPGDFSDLPDQLGVVVFVHHLA
jgi:hypothetical protein